MKVVKKIGQMIVKFYVFNFLRIKKGEKKKRKERQRLFL